MDIQARPVLLDSQLLLTESLFTGDTVQACIRKTAEDLLLVTRNAWLLGLGYANRRS